MRSTTSLFSRLTLIARSDRTHNLRDAISQHEFHSVNHLLMNPDGTLLSCKSKSDLVKALQELVKIKDAPPPSLRTVLVIDAMAVVQAWMHEMSFRSCANLGKAFADHIDGLLKSYEAGRVIFDNYTKVLPIKESICFSGTQKTSMEDLYINDKTPIRDKGRWLPAAPQRIT